MPSRRPATQPQGRPGAIRSQLTNSSGAPQENPWRPRSQPVQNTAHRNINLNATNASADDDDEHYVLAVEESRLKQHGPVPNRTRSRRISAVFKFRREKVHRTHRVFKLLTDTFRACVAGTHPGSGLLAPLELPTRGHRALRKSESQRLADVLMTAVNKAMRENGFKGLDLPLVELELLHLRKLVAGRPWSPAARAKGREDVTDPLRDALFYRLYRRNSTIVMHEANLVLYPYAAAYGLQTVKMKPATSEFLAKCIELRERTENGCLTLNADEIEELRTSEDLQAMVLTKLAEDDLSNIAVSNSVPWLRSHTAVQILCGRIMGIPNWEGLLAATRSRLAKYGDIAKRNMLDPFFDKYRAELTIALAENESPVHFMVRLLGAVTGTHRAYMTVADRRDLPDKKLRKLANGTRYQSCVIATSNSGNDKAEYLVYVQGTIVKHTKSLTKAYHTLFSLQNLLFLEGMPGSRSMNGLVEVINRLCWSIKYQKRKHAAIYDKLIGLLDNFLRDEESERELGHHSSNSS